jgi:hypothetical protein
MISKLRRAGKFFSEGKITRVANGESHQRDRIIREDIPTVLYR